MNWIADPEGVRLISVVLLDRHFDLALTSRTFSRSLPSPSDISAKI
jgi:hypothetical protein